MKAPVDVQAGTHRNLSRRAGFYVLFIRSGTALGWSAHVTVIV
jgi:hypothetical protein